MSGADWVFGKNEENLYKYGALDLDLNEIIPAEYDELYLASPKLIIAKKGEKYGLIDYNNKTVTDFNYKKIINFAGYASDDYFKYWGQIGNRWGDVHPLSNKFRRKK